MEKALSMVEVGSEVHQHLMMAVKAKDASLDKRS